MPYGRVEVLLGFHGRATKHKKERIMTHKLIYVNVKLFVQLNYFTVLHRHFVFVFLFLEYTSCELIYGAGLLAPILRFINS